MIQSFSGHFGANFHIDDPDVDIMDPEERRIRAYNCAVVAKHSGLDVNQVAADFQEALNRWNRDEIEQFLRRADSVFGSRLVDPERERILKLVFQDFVEELKKLAGSSQASTASDFKEALTYTSWRVSLTCLDFRLVEIVRYANAAGIGSKSATASGRIRSRPA